MVPPVGRPREFDEQEVLARALDTFWKYGYEATSVADLLQATGLQKGSLYQAFGDKHSLFLRTLDDYLTAGRASMERRLSGPGSLKEKLLGIMQISEVQSDGRRGCFGVNCLVEMAPHDADVQARLVEHYRLLESMLSKHLEQALCRGETQSPLPPPLLARLLVTLLTGAAAASKGHLAPGEANQTLAAGLDQIL